MTEQDHPRIRGEHHRERRERRGPKRIIPAYAGNTDGFARERLSMWGSSPHTRGTRRTPRTRPATGWDHPRIRGEHVIRVERVLVGPGIIPAYAGNTSAAYGSVAALEGSSPHTRGTLEELDARLRWLGIIPAYAGNTWPRPMPLSLYQGSSPHTRGTHIGVVRERFFPGIIPAYAGNTCIPIICAYNLMGSSPHTRGTPPARR